jgi:peptide deformylase
MILDLVKPDHPMIKTVLEPFDFQNPPVDPLELTNNLIETMVYYRGIGLSANQCGLPYRVFVLWSNPTKVCFNPRIVDRTTEEVLLDEGCLSFPNLFLPIKRPSVIKVRYQDATGQTITDKFIGMTSRAFQHELDHLDGIVYTRYANPIHLSRALNQKKKIDRTIKRNGQT